MESLLQTEGFAIFTTGILAILLAAILMLRNYLAGMMWGLSCIVLIFVGLFSVPTELFWMCLVTVFILLMAGMAVRGL